MNGRTARTPKEDSSTYVTFSEENVRIRQFWGERSLFAFHVTGDGPRFAEAFAGVWRQLPLGARRRLLKFWRETHPTAAGSIPPDDSPWPHIELISSNLKDFTRGNSGDAHAATAGAKWFYFDSEIMDRLSITAVQAVIAHELAHAYMFAGPYAAEHLAEAEYDEWGYSPREEIDDELAEAWGFDTWQLDEELRAVLLRDLQNKHQKEVAG